MTGIPVLLLFVLVALPASSSFISALLSSSLSLEDRSRIQWDLEQQLPIEEASSLSAYIDTLTLLSTPIPDVSNIISTLTPSLSSSDVSEVHDGVAALLRLHQKPTLTNSQLQLLSAALASPNLLILYHGASTLLLLHSSSSSSFSLSSYPFASALSTIQKLEELDHTYRVSAKAEDGNLYNTALVYDVLAAGAAAGLEGWNQAGTEALQWTDEVMALDKAYGLPGEVTEAEVMGRLVAGAVRLATAVKAALPLSPKQVEEAAEYLLNNRFAAEVEELHAVIAGLHAIASLPAPLSPLCLSISDPATLKSQLTNVLGSPVKGTSTVSIRSASGDSLSISDWPTAKPGHYEVTYSVDNESISLPVSKTGKLLSLSASVTTTDSAKDRDSDNTNTATFPDALPHPLTADGTKYLVVRITIDSEVTPSQVVTLLTRSSSANPSLSSDSTAVTPFPARKTADGSAYVTRINLGSLDVLEALGGGGSFIVHVLVGDELLDQSVDWPVADVELALPRLASPSSSPYQSTVTPIVHTFRQPDYKPSYLLPLVFTIALAAAFASLLLSVLRVASIEIPSSPVELSSAVLFQVVLCLLMLLYVLYWLRLNIFQALSGSIVLAVLAVLTGNKALTALHVRKAKLKQL